MAKKAPAKKKLSMSAMAREAIMSLKGKAGTNTIAAWVKQKYSKTLKSPHVYFSQAKTALAKDGGCTTVDAVRKYMLDTYGLSLTDKQASEAIKPDKRTAKKTDLTEADLDALIGMVDSGKEFIEKCGGINQAKKLLEILERGTI